MQLPSTDLLASAAASFGLALSAAATTMPAPDVPWSVFSFVFSSAAGVYTFFARRDAANAADLKRVERDLSVLTERVKHLPTSEEVQSLTVNVAALTKELSLTREGITAWQRRVERQEEFLLGGGSKTGGP